MAAHECRGFQTLFSEPVKVFIHHTFRKKKNFAQLTATVLRSRSSVGNLSVPAYKFIRMQLYDNSEH